MLRNTSKFKQQSGFTLVELIVVVVILGILSAYAVPRFFSLSGEARVSTVNAMAGALRSAAALAHTKQRANGAGANASVDAQGVTVTMINRYPTADSDGIINTLESVEGYTVSGGGALATSTITFTAQGAAGTCEVSYTPPATSTGNPTITVDAVTANCS